MFQRLGRFAIALISICLTACGGDEGDTNGHARIVEEAAAQIDLAGKRLLDPKSPAIVRQELEEIADRVADLTKQVEESKIPTSEARGALDRSIHLILEPAMGKLHAASVATLEKGGADGELVETLRLLEARIAEFDQALSASPAEK